MDDTVGKLTITLSPTINLKNMYIAIIFVIPYFSTLRTFNINLPPVPLVKTLISGNLNQNYKNNFRSTYTPEQIILGTLY